MSCGLQHGRVICNASLFCFFCFLCGRVVLPMADHAMPGISCVKKSIQQLLRKLSV